MRVGNLKSCERRISVKIICLGLVACAISAALCGCGDEGVEGVDGGWPHDPVPPENIMKFWADAYEKKDIDKYSACLAEVYTHSLSLTGGEEDYTVSLTREDDMLAARKLFEHECVTGIDMSILITSAWPTEEGVLYRLQPDIRIEVGGVGALGITPVTWAELKQTLAADELGCDPAVYEVKLTFFYVEMVKDPTDGHWWLISSVQESPM